MEVARWVSGHLRKIKNRRNTNMKNLSRRDFLRLSGAAVFAVGMTGALSGCDSGHVVTTSKIIDFNEEGRTSIGTIKFTKCYRAFNEAGTVNHNPEQWFVNCNAEITGCEGIHAGAGQRQSLDRSGWQEAGADGHCLRRFSGRQY